MLYRRGQSRIPDRVNRAYVAFGVNHVRAEKRLIRRIVNVPIRERADDRSRMFVHLHLFKPIQSGNFTANVRDISHKPQPIRSRQRRADACFAAVFVSGINGDLQ